MKKEFFLSVLCFSLVLNSAAQNDSAAFRQSVSSKVRFYFQGQVGLLEGQSGSSFQLQAISGVKAGSWRLGLGAGLDYYGIRSFPLFVAVQRDLGGRRVPLLAYIQAGRHLPWAKTMEDVSSKYKVGGYYDAGLGYRFNLNNKDKLIVSAGYSIKKYTEEREQFVYCIDGNCPPVTQEFFHTLKRLSFRVGWIF